MGEGEEVGAERRRGGAEGKGNPEPESAGTEARTSPETERGTTAGRGESGGRGSEAAAGRESRLWGVGPGNGESGEEGGPGSYRGGRWAEPSEEAGSRTGTAW